MKLTLQRIGPRQADPERIWGWVGLLVLVGSGLWLRCLGPPPVRCQFRQLTGLPCPTCGSTRSLAALAEGDLAGSFRMNPLASVAFLLALGYVPYALLATHMTLPRVRLVLSEREWRTVFGIGLALVVATWLFLILDRR